MAVTDREMGFVLPAGTVTLLLADIEGSSRHWEADPAGMAEAIGTFDRLVDDSVGRHEGVRPIERGEGDSFLAAFSRPSDAAACAVDLQRSFSAQLPFRVRMAVHTGEVEHRRDGDYVGTTVNRCARIRSLAHGGQVLVSRTARDLLADKLPDGAWLDDLGVHRLRDLMQPEHLYGLRHSSLGSDFPALRSLDQVRHNLPVQLTRFIGRDRDIDAVAGLLGENRLVTLTGSGGSGKTRLGLQVAASVIDDHSGGVWFVELAPVVAGEVIDALARTIGVRDVGARGALDAATAAIGDSPVLLVLDNCEHLVADAAAVACDVLSRCPAAVILATSREALNVPGEAVYDVPSLSMPPASPPPPLETVTGCEAAELFVDRAGKVRRDFAITDDNAAAVMEICRRLDGIPLAIELAAARTRVLTPRQICDGLQDRFRLLTGGARTLTPRQQTLRASVDWSHDLLDGVEQTVLRRLAVFAGGFELEGAERVASGGGIEPGDVLDHLTSLVEKSLVTVEANPGWQGRARYRLLETIRQYALERLAESADGPGAWRRHRDHHLDLLRGAAAAEGGPDQAEWLVRVQREMDNIYASLHLAARDRNADALLELACLTGNVWTITGGWVEHRRWLQEGLALAPPDHPLRASALYQLGIAETFLDELDRALGHIREAVPLYRDAGDACGAGWALAEIAYLLAARDGLAAATPVFLEARQLADAVGDAGLAMYVDYSMGYFEFVGGRGADAIAAFDRVLAGPLPLEHHARWAHGIFAWFLAHLGHVRRARSHSRGLVETGRAVADEAAVWWASVARSLAAVQAGDLAAASTWKGEAAAVHDGEAAGPFRATVLWLDGAIALAGGDPGLALAALDQAAEGFRPFSSQAERWVRWWRAEAVVAGGDEGAGAVVEALLAEARESDMPCIVGAVLGVRAWMLRAAGSPGPAETAAHDGLTLDLAECHIAAAVDCLELLGVLAADGQRYEEAARLWAAAVRLRDESGYLLRMPHRAVVFDAAVASARDALGVEAFDRAWSEGGALDAGAAAAYAARGRGERKRPVAGWEALTPMERRVVDLVARGHTNVQVGGQLFISRHTVDTHLRHVFAKLGVSNRAELTALVVRRQHQDGADA